MATPTHPPPRTPPQRQNMQQQQPPQQQRRRPRRPRRPVSVSRRTCTGQRLLHTKRHAAQPDSEQLLRVRRLVSGGRQSRPGPRAQCHTAFGAADGPARPAEERVQRAHRGVSVALAAMLGGARGIAALCHQPVLRAQRHRRGPSGRCMRSGRAGHSRAGRGDEATGLEGGQHHEGGGRQRQRRQTTLHGPSSAAGMSALRKPTQPLQPLPQCLTGNKESALARACKPLGCAPRRCVPAARHEQEAAAARDRSTPQPPSLPAARPPRLCPGLAARSPRRQAMKSLNQGSAWYWLGCRPGWSRRIRSTSSSVSTASNL